MNATIRFNSRAAALLAPLALVGFLTGCVGDDMTAPDDETFAGTDSSSELGLGAQGEDVRGVYNYLRRYGYFANPELAEHYPDWTPAVAREPADPEVFDEALEEGVRLFQRTSGLPVTGVVDDATWSVMQMPRCNFPDYYYPPSMIKHQHTSDFTLGGSKWSSSALTYRFANYTSDMSQSSVRSAVQSAMFSWTSGSAVSFSEVSSGEAITLGFYTGDHGDGSAFDGASGVLAHAYYPGGGGDVHFDDAETWSTSSSGKHLETVALHELGHALGLGHSSVSAAVMYAYYGGPRASLTYDDLAGMWALYGAYTSPTVAGDLYAGQGLGAGQSLWSWDGRFELAFQGDGNLVLYKSGQALWASGTHGKGGDRVIMQEDGNLVIYKSTGEAVWATGTNGSSNYNSRLVVQNDGNLVMYRPAGGVVWASNTCCH